jgi:hypothetical protein
VLACGPFRLSGGWRIAAAVRAQGEPPSFEGHPYYPGGPGKLGGVVHRALVVRGGEIGAGLGDGGVVRVAVRDQPGEFGFG